MCRVFGLGRDHVIHQYITTLLLLEEDEEGAGDQSTDQDKTQPLCHAGTVERVMQVIPMLHSYSELTGSLCVAILKVCLETNGSQSFSSDFEFITAISQPNNLHSKGKLSLIKYVIFFSMQLSPYNYERIEIVLQILQAVDKNVTALPVDQVRKEALFR